MNLKISRTSCLLVIIQKIKAIQSFNCNLNDEFGGYIGLTFFPAIYFSLSIHEVSIVRINCDD